MYDDDTKIIREAEDDVTTRPAEDPAEKEREEAFNSSFSWRGVTFEGLPCSRKDLWTALCWQCGFPPVIAGCDDLQWFVPQARALIYVCSQETKRLRRLKGLGINAVREDFEEWVDENITHKDEPAIIDLGQRILMAANRNQAEAVGSGDSLGK